MTASDVTLGEVDRNVQQLRQELREGLANVSSRMDRALDGTVPARVYAADKNAFEYRLNDAEKALNELKTQLERKEEVSRGQKNLVLIALIFPLLILFINTSINVYFRATGKG